jgi:hypothetical protein
LSASCGKRQADSEIQPDEVLRPNLDVVPKQHIGSLEMFTNSRLMEMVFDQKRRRPMTPDEMVRFYAGSVERPEKRMSRIGQWASRLGCLMISAGQRLQRPAIARELAPCA